MEFVFLGIFTVELILRLIVSGPKKFFSYQNDDFSWYLGGVFFLGGGKSVGLCGVCSLKRWMSSVFLSGQ